MTVEVRHKEIFFYDTIRRCKNRDKEIIIYHKTTHPRHREQREDNFERTTHDLQCFHENQSKVKLSRHCEATLKKKKKYNTVIGIKRKEGSKMSNNSQIKNETSRNQQ